MKNNVINLFKPESQENKPSLESLLNEASLKGMKVSMFTLLGQWHFSCEYEGSEITQRSSSIAHCPVNALMGAMAQLEGKQKPHGVKAEERKANLMKTAPPFFFGVAAIGMINLVFTILAKAMS